MKRGKKGVMAEKRRQMDKKKVEKIATWGMLGILGVLGVLGVGMVRMVAAMIVNEVGVAEYEKGENGGWVEALYPLNFYQTYIAYYNHGNLLYRQEKFAEAEEKYREALQKKPPKKKVCEVRVNLGLAIVRGIDPAAFEEDDVAERLDWLEGVVGGETFSWLEESGGLEGLESFSGGTNEAVRDEARERLEEARMNLYEDECAHPEDDNGRSPEAEKLEKEIREMEEKLKDEEAEKEEPQNDKEEEKPKEEEPKNVEEKLKEIEKQANESRQGEMSSYENFGDYTFYSGKKW